MITSANENKQITKTDITAHLVTVPVKCLDTATHSRIYHRQCHQQSTITLPPPCFTVGTTHAEIIRSPTLRLTKPQQLESKISNLDSSDQRTDFHWSNVHCSCFFAQASLLGQEERFLRLHLKKLFKSS